MTIRVYGVKGSMDTTHWARIMRAQGKLQSDHGIIEGLAVTTTATPREVSIASGRSLQGGTDLDSSDVVTKLGDANDGSQPRIDLVCSQVDWAAGKDMNTAGDFVIVKGEEAGTPVLPSLQQDEGVKWQEPLARYQMQGGVISGLQALGSGGTISQAIALAAGWSSPGATPLTVELRNGLVLFGGRLTRTAADFSDTATFGDGVFIPEGFRPTRTQNVWIGSDLADAATPTDGHMIVKPDGTMAIYIFHGSVATGQTLRVTNTTWIGA